MQLSRTLTDERLYRKILQRVSELDSPVIQPSDLAKRRKLQKMSISASESEHKLDPHSLERSFENAATSAVKLERSPLDHMN